MFLYVELWKARTSWSALSPDERTAYVNGLGPAIERLLQDGVELVGFALNDRDTPHRAPYQYIAVWKMPDARQVTALETAVENAGFHDYFEQVNARGNLITAEEALFHMVRHPG
jgi:hypothetical protein